jgi:hypothetical protein
MARGGHGLPKVSLGPAMLDLSMPCGQATHETAIQIFQRWPTHRFLPSSTLFYTPRRMPMFLPSPLVFQALLYCQLTPARSIDRAASAQSTLGRLGIHTFDDSNFSEKGTHLKPQFTSSEDDDNNDHGSSRHSYQ